MDDHAVIEETIEQVCLADEMGFDYVWFVEHHFLTTFSMSPCPEVIFGALSKMTKRIRLGFGVVIFGALSRLTKRIRLGFGVVILPYHHPVRVAERVAMVDHLTNGRVDMGTGRSAAYEQTGMGIDPRDTREMWEESLRMIPKIWESDYFEWAGQVLERAAAPSAAQAVPAAAPAHLGGGVAAGDLRVGGGARHRRDGAGRQRAVGAGAAHRRLPGEREEGQAGRASSSTTSGSVPYSGCAARTTRPPGSCARIRSKTFFGPGRPYVQDQKDVYSRLLDQWGGIPEHLQQNFSRYIDVPAEGEGEGGADAEAGGVDLSGGTALAQKIWEEFDADTLAERGVIVAGDPDSCIKAAKLHEATGVDQLQFLMATETVAHDKVMESIEMFGKHVFPAFK